MNQTDHDGIINQLQDELRISEENCEYDKAHNLHGRLQLLKQKKKQESEVVDKMYQIQELVALKKTHHQQLIDFRGEWDKFLKRFEDYAELEMRNILDRQEKEFRSYQQELKEKVLSRPPRWSRELLQLRKQQCINADQQNYLLAHKMKAHADSLEEKERKSMNNFSESSKKKECNLSMRHQLEVQVLEKRIRSQRSSLEKDFKEKEARLIKRNARIQNSKHRSIWKTSAGF